MPSYELVSQWIMAWIETMDPVLVQRAFSLCGIGEEEFRMEQLHSAMLVLMMEDRMEDFDSDGELLVDDDDVYEFDAVDAIVDGGRIDEESSQPQNNESNVEDDAEDSNLDDDVLAEE